MLRIVIEYLKWIHLRIPLWLTKIYMPLIDLFRNLGSLRLQVSLLSGSEKETGQSMRILYAGRDIRVRHYWERKLFREDAKSTPRSGEYIWKLRQKAFESDPEADLMLVEVSPITRLWLPSGVGFLLPRWLYTLIEVNNSLDAINNNDTHKHIRKHGMSFRIGRSMEDLQYFYDKMFLPYIGTRYKDAAVVLDYKYFQKRYRNKDSALFFLLKNERPIAASFNERKNRRLKFSGLGILDGDREIIRMGAVRALYFFMLEYYHGHGIRWIDFGGAPAMLSDGLTLFKLSLRAVPHIKSIKKENAQWFVPLRDSPVGRDVLKMNPFLYMDQGELFRALFMDMREMEKKKTFLKTLKRTRFRGISGTRIYFRGDPDEVKDWIKEESISDIELISFDKIFPVIKSSG